MFESRTRIGDAGQGFRFSRATAGPSRTLNYCLRSLQRGDRGIVIIARHTTEMKALLCEVARLCGPGLQMIARIDAAEIGDGLGERLRHLGLMRGVPWEMAAPKVSGDGARLRKFLVVESAHMLSPSAIGDLVDLREAKTGQPVQVLLAGSNHLLPLLCAPSADRFWRQVKLAISLEEPVCQGGECDIARLEEEISRTQARLAAQKRILSIFADSPGSAPLFES